MLTVSKAILAQISYWANRVGGDAFKGTYRLHTVIPGSSHDLRVRNRVAAANIAWRKTWLDWLMTETEEDRFLAAMLE